MAVAMTALVARLRSQGNHSLLPDLARRCLILSWTARESYATRSMPAKSRGAWEVSCRCAFMRFLVPCLVASLTFLRVTVWRRIVVMRRERSVGFKV